MEALGSRLGFFWLVHFEALLSVNCRRYRLIAKALARNRNLAFVGAFTPVLGEHTKKLELRRTSTQSAEPQGSCVVMWPLGLGSICGRGRLRWPSFWTAILVYDQRGRTCRQYLKGLKKFNDLVLLVLGQGVEGLTRGKSLAVVCFYGLP